MNYGGCFEVPQKQSRILELEKISSSQDFWQDQTKATEIINEANIYNNKRKDSRIQKVRQQVLVFFGLYNNLRQVLNL